MIAIPNMKLPPCCGKCTLQDGEICYAINENDIGSGLSFFDLEDLRNFCIKRRDDCPIIEIDLVKCGECTEWHEYARQNLGRNLGRCDCWFITTGDDDFCSYGEREDE